MNSNHYKEKKEFRIYAIRLRAEANYVYVGKTAGQRLSAVYSRHTTGGVKATEGYFDQGERLEFYLLEEKLQVTTSEAYKHVVAWCHIFQQAGYTGINHERTLSQAENLLPETRAIVESLSQEPLEQILQCARLDNLASADKTAEKNTCFEAVDHSPEETIQMNIRIEKRNKETFDQFCKDGAMSQREGFLVLLDRIAASEEYPRVQMLMKERDRKIISLEQDKQKLQKKLDTWISHGKSERELRLEKKLIFLSNGIRQYLQLLFPDTKKKLSLPETSYRKFTKRLPYELKPQYPEAEGFLVLRLEAILWGNSLHRACFVVGIGEDGHRYRLRCYPHHDHIGLYLRESSYASPGACWYLGCKRGSDGAMDLIAAMPLLQENECSEWNEHYLSRSPEQKDKKPSLDSKIKIAEEKRT